MKTQIQIVSINFFFIFVGLTISLTLHIVILDLTKAIIEIQLLKGALNFTSSIFTDYFLPPWTVLFVIILR